MDFEVIKAPHRSTAGDELFTVVAYRDGQCLGGDHHWVRERYAERVKLIYEHWPSLHGRPSSHLAEVWEWHPEIFGTLPLFDKD
jgi:hypothetical protein